jgi:hypothetical protein
MTSIIRLLNSFNLFKKEREETPSSENIKVYHTVKYISGFENYHRLDYCKKVQLCTAQASIKHWYVQRKN